MPLDIVLCPHCEEHEYDLIDNECNNCGAPHFHQLSHGGSCQDLYNQDEMENIFSNHKLANVKITSHKFHFTTFGIPIEKINNIKRLTNLAKRTWNPQSDCTLEEHINKFLKKAAQPPEFVPGEGTYVGLPRPHYRVKPEDEIYDFSHLTQKKPEQEQQEGTRRLFKKFPVPWNSLYITEEGVPDFYYDEGLGSNIGHYLDNPDKMEHFVQNSTSYKNKACPMCGGKFEDDEPVVAYKGANNGSFVSDFLPYHNHCMDLVNIHCPHLRREERNNPNNYEHGSYKELIGNVVQNFTNAVQKDYDQ
jgi:hypothetical protein